MQGAHYALHSINQARLAKEGLIKLMGTVGIELGFSAFHARVLYITLRPQHIL